MRILQVTIALLFALSPLAAEVLEVGKAEFDELPKGQESDGIVGDFLLRNDLIEVVISGNLPLRRANMGTFYKEGGETPGCIYDLGFRGENNDQLTIFSPLGQKGMLSWVRISEGGTAVEAVATPAVGGGIYRQHEYHLEEGWPGVFVTSTLRNESGSPQPVELRNVWKSFSATGNAFGVAWGDAVDPSRRCAYAWGRLREPGTSTGFEGKTELAPGEEIKAVQFLAVGRSPAEAIGHVLARQGRATATVEGSLLDADGAPVASGKVSFKGAGDAFRAFPAYPDAEGRFSFQIPAGKFTYTAEDNGHGPIKGEVEVAAGPSSTLAIKFPSKGSGIVFDVRDGAGKAIPCKVQFIGVGETPAPNLGPTDRAHGCKDQYHSERGDFQVGLRPGSYRVVVTRGPEFSHHEEEVTLAAGGEARVGATLSRVIDTAGWVSADFHNHSTPSGDNTCPTDSRIANLAAEHIEFAPTTEHNRIYDWQPHIDRLGLAGEMSTVIGLELTGPGAHFNSFPLKRDPKSQDGGAPVWDKDPRVNALNLEAHGGGDHVHHHKWVQINHPDLAELFFDCNKDGKIDGGFANLGNFINGFETENFSASSILTTVPFQIVKQRRGIGRMVRHHRPFLWLQMLNQGHRIWATAVSDAHRVYDQGVGGWRVYLPSSTDDAGALDPAELIAKAQAGQMVLTTGPFLEVATAAGTISGGEEKAPGGAVALRVKVQCNTWLDIDRVQVLVNGRQVPELNFTRASHPGHFRDGVVKFEQEIAVPLKEDAHLIVVAFGENSDLTGGFGTSPTGKLRPCAYHNPIFIDVDGGGFSPNGDTLGWDLPTKGITVEEAQKLLSAE